MRFHEKLQTHLNALPISKAEAAKRAGLKVGAIGSYLARRSTVPRADIALKLARAAGVPLEYLLDDAQNQPPPANILSSVSTEELCEELGNRMLSMGKTMLAKIIQAEGEDWIAVGRELLQVDPDSVPKRLLEKIENAEQIRALSGELRRYNPCTRAGNDLSKELAKYVSSEFEITLLDLWVRSRNLEDKLGYRATCSLGSMLTSPKHWRPPWFGETLAHARAQAANELEDARIAAEAELSRRETTAERSAESDPITRPGRASPKRPQR